MVRGEVERSGAGHAQVRVTGAAEVLDGGERPARTASKAVAHCPLPSGRYRVATTKRTRVPGASSAAGSRAVSHSTGVGACR